MSMKNIQIHPCDLMPGDVVVSWHADEGESDVGPLTVLRAIHGDTESDIHSVAPPAFGPSTGEIRGFVGRAMRKTGIDGFRAFDEWLAATQQAVAADVLRGMAGAQPHADATVRYRSRK